MTRTNLNQVNLSQEEIRALLNVAENLGNIVNAERESNVEDLILEWLELKEQENELKKRLEEIYSKRQQVANKIKESGIISPNEKVNYGGYKISWTVFNKNQLDTKKLKAEKPEIYTMYSKTVKQERFEIK